MRATWLRFFWLAALGAVSATGNAGETITFSGTYMVRYMEGAPVARPPTPSRNSRGDSARVTRGRRPIPPGAKRPPPGAGGRRKPPPPSKAKPLLRPLRTPPQLQLVCPEIIDPSTGFVETTVSNCTAGLPLALTVAEGYGLTEDIWNSERLLSGELVNATVEVAADGGITLLRLQPIKYGCAKECEINMKLPIRDRAIVYLLDLSTCGGGRDMRPALSVEEAQRLLWRAPSDTAVANMEAYVDTCSYGKRVWLAEETMVVGPVPMPCTGALLSSAAAAEKGKARWGGLTAAASGALRLNGTHAGWWDLARWCSATELLAIERVVGAYVQKMAGGTAAAAPGTEAAKLRRLLQTRGAWPRRDVFVLPPGSACARAWTGLAATSCKSVACPIFVNGGEMAAAAARDGVSSSNGARLLMHELMHTIGAPHSNHRVVEAGDETDVMGACLVSSGSSSTAASGGSSSAGLLCPSAPTAYRLGWATPINTPGTPPFAPNEYGTWGNLTAANFSGASNEIKGLVIPAAGTRDDNMLVVNLGATSPLPNTPRIPAPTHFISYRVRNTTRGGFDSGLPQQYSHALLLHVSTGDANPRIHGYESNLLDWFPVYDSGSRKTLPHTWVSYFQPMRENLGGALQVRVVSASDREVVVRLCRKFEHVETCTDGLDGDCNGLIDDEDPACR